MKIIRTVGIFILSGLYATITFAETSQTIGWIEHVAIHPHNMIMTAKIDTGADNSSVHAENINVYDNNGIKVVSFTLRNKQSKTIHLEKPLLRFTQIKSKTPGAEPIQRPVVEMSLCLGGNTLKAPVNLANRENFRYRMLIGRSYLKKGYVVDPNSKHILQPGCNEKSLATSQ